VKADFSIRFHLTRDFIGWPTGGAEGVAPAGLRAWNECFPKLERWAVSAALAERPVSPQLQAVGLFCAGLFLFA
jgi:hypothetical protein